MFRILTCSVLPRRAFSDAVFTFKDNLSGKYSDTFQFWILKQFKNNNCYITHEAKQLNKIELQDFNSRLGTLSSNEILDFMWNRNGGIEPSLRKRLDNELKLRIKDGTTTDELLCIVDTCIRVCPTHVAELSLYKEALSNLEKIIATSNISLHHRLQCMYYASITKKSVEAKRLISILLNNINQKELKLFEDYELGIFCNALFRSSIVVPDKFLVHIIDHLKSRLSSFLEQPAIFICIIKSLRHAMYYDAELFKLLSDHIRNIRPDLKLSARIHLLAYYSGGLYNDQDLLSDFINSSIDDIDHLIRSNNLVRLKDMDRLLWSASNYNLETVKDKLNRSSIVNYISFLGKTDFKNRPEAIINALLWLWILECNKREDLCSFITENNIRKIKGTRHFKNTAKLYLLLTCISIEAPHLIDEKLFFERDNKLMPRINRYLTARPKLYEVLNLVNANKKKLGLEEVICEFKIPCLYIGGITLKSSRGECSIEVFDETVCLQGSETPHGRMQLKMRLLKALNIPTYTVHCSRSDSDNVLNINYIQDWILSNIQ